nr:DUF4465 domain-containing protein [Chitinophagaceae bacterium]
NSARIANTTIAYRSMQNGDGFAKIFGGATGNDPDFFKVTFTGWLQNTTTGSIDFYLADFRDTVNSNDYILKDWGTVDLMPLGLVDSITFHLSSSDTNSLGMKTPAYFCLDNLSMLPASNSAITRTDFVTIYPNPFQQEFNLSNSSTEEVKFQLMDIMGRVLLEGELHAHEKINIQTLQMGQGTYFLRANINESVHTQTLLKIEN